MGVAAGRGVNTCPPWKARKQLEMFYPTWCEYTVSPAGGSTAHSLQSPLKCRDCEEFLINETKSSLSIFGCECYGIWDCNNYNLQFLSARRCRQQDTSSLPPRCSTTARPRGWWALPPSPKPSETLAYTCRDRRVYLQQKLIINNVLILSSTVHLHVRQVAH